MRMVIEKKPKISVIVPFYNAEATLARCLDSLIVQTFADFEALLIDDGSTDGSAVIAAGYARRDGRFRVFRQDNSGAGAARNLGLSESAGAYICFLDADDGLLPDYLEQMLTWALRDGADLVVSNPILVSDREAPRALTWYGTYQLTRDKAGYYELALRERDGMQLIPPWGKLIRAELAKSSKFPNMRFCEDAAYVLRLLENRPLLAAVPYAGYRYVQAETSQTGAVPVTDPARVFSALTFNRQMYRRYREVGGRIRREVANAYAKRVYIVLLAFAKNGDEKGYWDSRETLTQDAGTAVREKGLEGKVLAILRLYSASPKACWKALRAGMICLKK